MSPDRSIMGGLEIVATSLTYPAAKPSLSALVLVGESADPLHPTLDSLSAMQEDSIEIVVIEDAPKAPSAAEWVTAHPRQAAIALRRPNPRGREANQGAALDMARGEHCLMLTAGTVITRNALIALREALSRAEMGTVIKGIVVIEEDGMGSTLDDGQTEALGGVCFASVEVLRKTSEPSVATVPAIVGHLRRVAQ